MANIETGTITLTKAQIREISETAAQVAVNAYQKRLEHGRDDIRDKRLYNTRLLMEKYRGLVKYSDDAIYEAKQIDDDDVLAELIELMSRGRECEELSVESIQERVVRTRIVLRHVDRMLDFYRYRCTTSGKDEIARKWDVVYYLYLADKELTIQELATKYCVDERSIYRYNNTALKDLSALFFGCIE